MVNGKRILPQHLARLLRKLECQFPTDIPEGKLMFSVVEAAVIDCNREFVSAEVVEYFAREIPHCAVCGVNSSWVRR